MNHVWSSLGALLLPRHCLLCNHPGSSPLFSLPNPSAYMPFICSDCASGFQAITRPVCEKCGYPGSGGSGVKHACVLASQGVGCHVALFRSGYHYEGKMMETVQRWKYQPRHLLLPLVEKLVDLALERWGADFHDVDMVAALPLAAADWRARGFNQALVIANRCALYLQKPLKRRLLIKTRKTAKQAGLHRDARMINLAGVFSLGRPDDLVLHRVTLLDLLYDSILREPVRCHGLHGLVQEGIELLTHGLNGGNTLLLQRIGQLFVDRYHPIHERSDGGLTHILTIRFKCPIKIVHNIQYAGDKVHVRKFTHMVDLVTGVINPEAVCDGSQYLVINRFMGA